VNNRFLVAGTFPYLEKACDCVNHGIVVDKLEFYGIMWKISLIRTYLTVRYQKVLIGAINA